MENLVEVMAPVQDWYDLGHFAYGLCVPPIVLDQIRDNEMLQTEDEKKVAFLQYYYDNVAIASWQNVAAALHYKGERAALAEAKKCFVTSIGKQVISVTCLWLNNTNTTTYIHHNVQ